MSRERLAYSGDSVDTGSAFLLPSTIQSLLAEDTGFHGDEDEEDDDEDDEPLDVKEFDSLEEYKESLKAQEQAKKSKKWGWESLLFDLCEGDLTKIKAVGELPLIFVFNMLSMRKEMGYLETPKG